MIDISKTIVAAVNTLNEQRKKEGLSEIPEHLFTAYHYVTVDDCKDANIKSDCADHYSFHLGKQFTGFEVEVVSPISTTESMVESEMDAHTFHFVNVHGDFNVYFSKEDRIREFYWKLALPLSAIRIDTKEDTLKRFNRMKK